MYIRIIMHKFPRKKFRSMEHSIYPAFPSLCSLPSSQEQFSSSAQRENQWVHWGWQGSSCFMTWTQPLLLSIGWNLCSRPEVSTRDVTHWYGREALSTQMAIIFHPGPGDLAKHEFLPSRMICFESELELGCRQSWERMRWVSVSTFVLVHFCTSIDTDTSSVTHSTSALRRSGSFLWNSHPKLSKNIL